MSLSIFLTRYRRKTGYFHALSVRRVEQADNSQLAGDAPRVISGCVPFQSFFSRISLFYFATPGCVFTLAQTAGAPGVFPPPLLRV